MSFSWLQTNRNGNLVCSNRESKGRDGESTERERQGTGLYGAPMCKGSGGDKAGNLELEPNQLKFCPHLMNWNSSIPRFHPRAVRIFN